MNEMRTGGVVAIQLTLKGAELVSHMNQFNKYFTVLPSPLNTIVLIRWRTTSTNP
jgi:hypothetical protein